MLLTFRQATEADRDSLFDLHRATMREYIDAEWGWNDAWQREYFDRKFNPEAYQILQIEGKEAGVLVVERTDDEIYLGLIEISPPYQGRGIGTEIVCRLIDEARQQHKTLALHVLRTNSRAIEFYKQLGFVVETVEWYRLKMKLESDPQVPA